MATNHSERLVAGGRSEGIVEIRKSAILAILLVIGLFGGLVLWLMHSAHPAVASASPQTFGTLHGSDVSTINQNETKHSDALPVPRHAMSRKAPDESTLDTSLVASAQTPSQIGQQPAPASQADTTTATALDSSAPRADDAARLEEQRIEDARDSAMDVKLGGDDGTKGTTTNAPPPVTAAQPATTQIATETPPSGPILQRGMIIPASLYTPIDSTVPGIVTAQIPMRPIGSWSSRAVPG